MAKPGNSQMKIKIFCSVSRSELEDEVNDFLYKICKKYKKFVVAEVSFTQSGTERTAYIFYDTGEECE